MAGPFGPFESTIERLGDTLINKVADEIFWRQRRCSPDDRGRLQPR
jgi:hypothetical protein